MNKKLWIIACTLLLAAIGTTNAQQYEAEKNFKVEKVNGGKAIRIVEYKGKNTNVNIPPQISKLPVVEIGDFAFAKQMISEVTIPDSVTKIGSRAFTGSNKITIGSNVSFDRSAFNDSEFLIIYEKYKKVAGTYLRENGRWSNPEVDREIAEKQRAEQQAKLQEQQAQRAQQEREAVTGYIQLISVFEGSVLLNGEATQYTVRANNSVFMTIENAKDKEYTVAVSDSNGTVRQATIEKITITETGLNKDKKPNRTYEALILDPNPQPDSGDDFEIRQNAQGGITITKYTGSRMQVVIPETISGIKVTEIAANTFMREYKETRRYENGMTVISGSYSNRLIYSVVIPNTVTIIGENAFSGQGIRRVTLSNTLSIISKRAFYNCYLDTVTIPNSVTAIHAEAFANNQLTSITFGNRVADIGENAFYNNKLTELTNLPASLRTIYKNAFAKNAITKLTIPNGVTIMSIYCFEQNPIDTLVIPPSLAKYTRLQGFIRVGEDDYSAGFARAFQGNRTPTTITLPANVDDGNLSNNFYSTLVDFYKSQNKKAGTYSFDGRLWTVK